MLIYRLYISRYIIENAYIENVGSKYIVKYLHVITTQF